MSRTVRRSVTSRIAVATMVAVAAAYVYAPSSHAELAGSRNRARPITLYLEGDALDQVSKLADKPSATFSDKKPADPSGTAQTMIGGATEDFVANPAAAYWFGDFSGRLDSVMTFCWYWSSINPAAVGQVLQFDVVVFGDPEWVSDPAGFLATPERRQLHKIIGRETIKVTASATPTLVESKVRVKGMVKESLMVQAATVDPTRHVTGLLVHYGSSQTPSFFTTSGGTCE